MNILGKKYPYMKDITLLSGKEGFWELMKVGGKTKQRVRNILEKEDIPSSQKQKYDFFDDFL